MIPKTNALPAVSFQESALPSRTWEIDWERGCLRGQFEGIDAVKQTVFGILNTERYDYVIFSWNYGIERNRVFGHTREYVCSELKRRITDALIQDDRIGGVDSFSFDWGRGKVTVSFTVHTIYGDYETEQEVRETV